MIKDTIVEGFHNAPHRSLYHALGLTDEEQRRPLIGIVSSHNEIVPGHVNLDKIADAVKLGVAMAGGTPIMFPAITVCDGIAMGHVGMKYSLVTRDLIADSTEAMVMAAMTIIVAMGITEATTVAEPLTEGVTSMSSRGYFRLYWVFTASTDLPAARLDSAFSSL